MRSSRGALAFSLIEVMIAATILLIGIGGTTAALHSFSRVQEHQRYLASAATVGGNALEETIVEEDARTLAAGSSTSRWDARGRRDPGGAFVVERTVAPDDPIEHGRRIDIVVRWQERGDDREYRLRTYAYRTPSP